MQIDKALMEKAAKIMKEWGNSVVSELRHNLNERLKENDSESNLSQSIQVYDTFVIKNKVQFVLALNDYFIYIDLGVKGVKNKSITFQNDKYPSGFHFKNLGTPPQMINSLQNYIARKGIPVRKSKSQSSKSVLNQSFQMAKSMAIAIKRKGIDGTRFFSDVYDNDAFIDLEKRLELGLGHEIEINIGYSLLGI